MYFIISLSRDNWITSDRLKRCSSVVAEEISTVEQHGGNTFIRAVSGKSSIDIKVGQILAVQKVESLPENVPDSVYVLASPTAAGK